MSAGETLTITYGPVTVPAVGTVGRLVVVRGLGRRHVHRADRGLATVTVNAADGSGTMTVLPDARDGGLDDEHAHLHLHGGRRRDEQRHGPIAVPAGWSDPQTASNTSPGLHDAAGGTGSNTIAWNAGMRKLTISSVTLAAARR